MTDVQKHKQQLHSSRKNDEPKKILVDNPGNEKMNT